MRRRQKRAAAHDVVISWLIRIFGSIVTDGKFMVALFVMSGWLLSMFMSNGSLVSMLASVGIPLAVGELMNRVHLPRVRNTDILFASGVTNTIFEEGHRISGYSLIELNRLIEDGCNFTVETIEAPASIHELLRDVDLRLPVIGMDGAILFDMKERTYLEAVMMDPERAVG